MFREKKNYVSAMQQSTVRVGYIPHKETLLVTSSDHSKPLHVKINVQLSKGFNSGSKKAM